MPATSTVQRRIQTFESGIRPPSSPSPSPSPKPSLIDDWIVDDGPPLISLQSPVSPRPAPPTVKPKPASLLTAHRPNTLAVPPLSPDPQTPNESRRHAPSSSISSFHSVSLSSDTDSSSRGSVSNYIATFPIDDDYPSLSESYEEVSTSSLASPVTERLIQLDWQRSPGLPPKLPQRPPSRSPSTATHSPRPSYKPAPPPSHPVSRATSVSSSTPTSPILRPALSAAASSSSLAVAANTLTNPPYTPRRPAPPPPLPSRSSDRSSIRSIATTTSSSSFSTFSQPLPQQQQRNTLQHTPSLLSLAAKAKRPTPVPLAARKRYEAVFTANILQRRRAEKRSSASESSSKPALLSPGEARGRRAVGWRGLSIDLITGDELAQSPVDDDPAVDGSVGPDEKLEASIVRLIWKRSGLSNAQLSDIWNECDITGKGALSLDGFTKGMWRIDEELRRAQTRAIKSATNGAAAYRSNSLRSTTSTNTTSSSSHQHRQHHPHRPRDILR